MEKKRANSVITTTLVDDGKTLQFNVLGIGTLDLDITKLHADILTRAAIHGMKQRVSDAAAIPCDPETGKPASAQEKFDAMARLVEHYNSGSAEWGVRVASGERAAPKEGKVITAMTTVYQTTPEHARKLVGQLAEKRGIDYKTALAVFRGADKIKDELARMAASAPAKVDADSLLSELNG